MDIMSRMRSLIWKRSSRAVTRGALILAMCNRQVIPLLVSLDPVDRFITVSLRSSKELHMRAQVLPGDAGFRNARDYMLYAVRCIGDGRRYE